MYNPDYPTMCGSFTQHTYRPLETTNETFFYSGINPFGNQPMTDSRRNFNMNNGGYPTGTAGVPVETQMKMSPSYQNGVPMNGTPAFNSLIDSRRSINVNNTPAAASSNPWANNQQNVIPNNSYATPTMGDAYANPYQNMFNYPPVEMSSMALYNDASQIGFDRKAGCWENSYTNPRTIPVPNVNWNQVNNAPPTTYQPMYPVAPTSTSWLEIAERNWGSGNL